MLPPETLQKLVDLAQPATVELDGETYSTRQLHKVQEPHIPVLTLGTLTALVEYLNSNVDDVASKCPILVVDGPARVSLILEHPELRGERHVSAQAVLARKPFAFGQWFDQETFIVSLQTLFVEGPTQKDLIQIAGTILKDDGVKATDDGMSQKVTARSGVSFKQQVKLPSPIALQPYRTFREVGQAVSPFIVCLKEAHEGIVLALFEADGGAWQIGACEAIRAFLHDRLNSSVPILA